MKTYTVVGREEEGPLCDPGSELLLGGREGERSARIINGIRKKQTNIGRRVLPPPLLGQSGGEARAAGFTPRGTL